MKYITVLQGEVLTGEQVLALFRAFHNQQPMPPEFAWRDISRQLKKLSMNMAEKKAEHEGRWGGYGGGRL